jgi:hypothetical protein
MSDRVNFSRRGEMIVRTAQGNPVQAVLNDGPRWDRPDMQRPSLTNAQTNYEPSPNYGRFYESNSGGSKYLGTPSLANALSSGKNGSHVEGSYGYDYPSKPMEGNGQVNKGYGNAFSFNSNYLNSNRRSSVFQVDGQNSHDNKENSIAFRGRESSLYEVEIGRGQHSYGDQRLTASRTRRSQQYETSNSTTNNLAVEGFPSTRTNSNFETLMGLPRMHSRESENDVGFRFDAKRNSTRDNPSPNNQPSIPTTQTHESNPSRLHQLPTNFSNSQEKTSLNFTANATSNQPRETEHAQLASNDNRQDSSLTSKIKFPERFRQSVAISQPPTSHESSNQQHNEMTAKEISGNQHPSANSNTFLETNSNPLSFGKAAKEYKPQPGNNNASENNAYQSSVTRNLKNDHNTSQEEIENTEMPKDEEELFECFEGCGRFFTREALRHHEKACKKIFQSKRKAFNIKAKRLEIKTQEAPRNQGHATNPKTSDKQKKAQVPKWKLESVQLRVNLKQARGGEASKNEPEIKVLDAAKKQPGIICPNCKLTFNEKVAGHHLPLCAEKGKEKAQGQGPSGKQKPKNSLKGS